MVHYITLGGQERPVCFSYAVAYEYEKQTGHYYEADVAALGAQIITAGARAGTDDVATAAREISMVKFIDILYACLLVGYRKERLRIDFELYDVAEWLTDNRDTVSQFATMLLEANFDLSGENQTDDEEPDDEKKRKPPTARKKLTGTNS